MARETVKLPAAISAINVLYAVGNLAVGILLPSAWFFIAGIYFLILSVSRLVVILLRSLQKDSAILLFVGIMLIVTSIPLVITVLLCAWRERGICHNEIVMISIALYSFIKATLAILNFIRARRAKACFAMGWRQLSLADAAVSILSLQRSMLATFGQMPASRVQIFNLATGSAVCIAVFLFGVYVLKSGRRSSEKRKKSRQC